MQVEPPGVIYEIRVESHLDRRWLEWFEGITLTHADNGNTLLVGLMRDQAALYGLLMKMRDLGLILVAVRRVEPNSEIEKR